MPIYQIYILVAGLTIVLIGGGVVYYTFQEEKRAETTVGIMSDDGKEHAIDEGKRSILDILLPSADTESSTGENGATSADGSLSDTGVSNGTGQIGSPQFGAGTESETGGPKSSSSSEGKDQVLKGLQVEGGQVSDEEKQSILKSLQ